MVTWMTWASGLLKGSWDLVSGYNWGYKSPKWGYPNYNLLVTLLTKSHEPLSRVCAHHYPALEAPAAREGGLRPKPKSR